MPDFFQLTPDIKRAVVSAFDSMINQWGKNCKIYFKPVWQNCPNCVTPNSQIGKKGPAIYRTGGPIPFRDGTVCPMCGSNGGYNMTQPTAVVKMICDINPATWYAFPQLQNIQVRSPDGYVQIRGFLGDVANVQKADFIEVEFDLMGGIRHYKYKLDGEPVDMHSIVQGHYFVALLKRAG